MTEPPNPSPRPPPSLGQTILVFGSGLLPSSLWAAGIAQRIDPEFSWADLGSPEPAEGKEARLLMARSSAGVWINGARPEDAAPPTISPEAFDRLIADGAGSNVDYVPLQEFLTLPHIVQLLAGSSMATDGTATIVLLGLDAVPSTILAKTFETPQLHDIVRREGITCIAAYRGTPRPSLLERFDVAFRLDGPAGRDWTETIVAAVRGTFPPELRRARLLREQWVTLGLSPELLDLWSGSGSLPTRPR